MSGFGVLRTPRYLGLLLLLTVALGWLYTTLSLRSAGMDTTVLTTKLATPQFEIDRFGLGYYYGSVALDLLTAFLTALLVTLTIAAWRARRTAGPGAVGSAASLLIAATGFG
jgi:hypothetical protein